MNTTTPKKEVESSPSSSSKKKTKKQHQQRARKSPQSSPLNKNSPDTNRLNVRVCCRVRPQNKIELSRGGQSCVTTDGTTVEVNTTDGSNHKYTYDHVFGENDGQAQVFDNVARPVVQDIMEGYNATIFAYGQTSSGKTYTMEGASLDVPELQGVIPRTATELFNSVLAADENIEFIVKVSYIEIYMEKIRDLLDEFRTKNNLQIREDKDKGIYVAGVTEVCVTSDLELLSVMKEGAVNRAVAATGMNEGSSRSHSVFMVTLYQRNLETLATKAGKLYLVDLAGSEMVRKTGASGQQLEEAKTINKSLSALGLVINALTGSSVSRHVPYRDSKLTRMLQESIGGNSRTALIINISPSSYNASETLSTLRFGTRAKNIQNKAIVNAERSVEEYKLLLEEAEKKNLKQATYIISLETQLSHYSSHERNSSDFERKMDELSIETIHLQGENDESASHLPSSPIATELAANALMEMQNSKLELEEKLKEEQDEVTRLTKEIRSLSNFLQDKNELLNQNQVELAEVQKKLEEDFKSEASILRLENSQELENLKLELEKVVFERDELALHTKTLEDELSNQRQSNAGEADNNVVVQDQIDVSIEREGNTEDASTISTEEEKDEEATRLQNRINFLENQFSTHFENWKMERAKLEEAKATLVDDIHRKNAKVLELASELDKLRMSSSNDNNTENSVVSTTGSGMSVRERQHMRSIQQKLEQLVAVHRQLLRKYASLELEINEAKQKLVLREDRIKQLEANTRMLAGNMRAQAERHVDELALLRDQINQLREDQQSHFDSKEQHPASSSGGIEKKKSVASVSNSKDGVIRTIRGGGGRRASPSSLNATSNTNSNLFSRLFGK